MSLAFNSYHLAFYCCTNKVKYARHFRLYKLKYLSKTQSAIISVSCYPIKKVRAAGKFQAEHITIRCLIQTRYSYKWSPPTGLRVSYRLT